MVLPRFVAAALSNEPLRVFGNGEQVRCFCDVRDVSRALIDLLGTPSAHGGIFNIGSESAISINTLAQTVIEVLGSASRIERVPYDEAYGPGFEDLTRRVPDLGDHPSRGRSYGHRRNQPMSVLAAITSFGLPPLDPGMFAAPESAVEAEADVLATTGLGIFHRYIWVFVAAFAITIIATPLVRRLALAAGIIDRPSDPRKVHRIPVAYLGGLAVFLGIMGGTLVSYLGTAWGNLSVVYPSEHMVDGEYHAVVPISILLGLAVITVVGLLDDAIGIRPGLKISGQLVAAAALAIENVGVRVAQGVLRPVGE
ncbi:UDP-glucuronic acid decarboxylase 4 (UDP-XYL synthase 4) (UDP-glucuronate decarboxylase 4) (UGD) (UXS-4), partial [Durusdinium trenchii]